MDSKIAFRAFGEGEAVVLLHGFAGSVSQWDPLRPLLAKYYRVIVPNLTHLTLGREEMSFSKQIDELHTFLQTQVSKDPIHVVGISYGAALTWGLATRYPESIARVVLINPMPPNPVKQFIWASLRIFLRLPANRFVMGLMLRTRWGRELLRSAAEIFRNVDHAPSLDRIEKLEGRKLLLVAHTILRFSWIVRKENWQAWMKRLSAWKHETLLVYEEEDPLIRYDSYEAFAKLIRCENSFVTQGAGHISTLNSPHMISWEVMKFLLDHHALKPHG